MITVRVENMPLKKLKADQELVVEELASVPPATEVPSRLRELATRYVQARLDAMKRDETMGIQGEKIQKLEQVAQQAVERNKVHVRDIAQLQAQLQAQRELVAELRRAVPELPAPSPDSSPA